MSIDNKMKAMNYWNRTDIIEEFASAAVPEYWKEFFQTFENSSEVKVLDLGCGGGRNTSMLVQMGFQVRACDLHEGMVRITRDKIRPLLQGEDEETIVQTANMLQLPFENDFFDVLLANGVYHNTSSVQEFKNAVKESVRVLKQDGFLCLNVFHDEIIENDLVKQEEPHLYITPDQIDMILLPKEEIRRILGQNSLSEVFEPIVYPSKINIGVRSVIRGVFKKEGNSID